MLILRRLFRHNCLVEVFQSTSTSNTSRSQSSLRSRASYPFRIYSTISKEEEKEDDLGLLEAQSDGAPTNIISKAVKYYVKEAQEYDEFRKKEIAKYEIGKRHLANMMGEDPENFTQDDIDTAIEYLFPSGLFLKEARPSMKHPLEMFPDKKSIQFDETGRPFTSLFYTGTPAYYELLNTIATKANTLIDHEEKTLMEKGEFKKPLNVSASSWISQNDLEKIIGEYISKEGYEFFIRTMDRFLTHPSSYLEEEFILKYRTPLEKVSVDAEAIPKLKYNEKGEPYSIAEGKRKWAVANVTLTKNESGNIQINGKNILYFQDIQNREQVLFPLLFTNMLKKVDISAYVQGGGTSSQAGAVRHAISLALTPFVDSKMQEYMRIAGLLTHNRRRNARKVYGQKGARAKYTWKKR